MKRIMILSLAILMVCGVAMADTPGYRSDPGTGDILGGRGLQSDAHKIFRMVRYVPTTWSGSTTLAADSIVVWDLTSDDGVTVTTTTTSGDSAVAGIIVQQALTPEKNGTTLAQDRGKRNWTWLQTYGKSKVNFAGSASTLDSVAGDSFGTSTTAGEIVQWGIHPADTITYRGNGKAGFFYDADAGGTDDVEVFLIGLD